MRRGGWTLIEMLACAVLLVAVVAVVTPVFRGALRAMPQAAEAVEAARQVGIALARMQQDIDAATSLSPSADALLIEGPGGVVGYAAGDGTIERFRVTARGRRTDRTWPTPNARLRWRVWQRGGRPSAVEVRTWIQIEGPDHPPLTKLANARVFFLPARPKEARP